LLQNLNFHSQYVPKGITYDSTAIIMDQNPIRTALSVCNYLINQSVSINSYVMNVSPPSPPPPGQPYYNHHHYHRYSTSLIFFISIFTNKPHDSQTEEKCKLHNLIYRKGWQPFDTCTPHSTFKFLMCITCVGYIDNYTNRKFMRTEWEMMR
jgi:hypothetical protein